MTYSKKQDEILSSLLRAGFSFQESIKYLRSFQLESEALSSTHLFRNGGIKRVQNEKEE